MARLKSAQEILMMRKAGRLASETLRHVEPLLKPGISTEAINVAVHEYVTSHGAYPSPLRYRGYPKSVCTSVNNVICHGIPSEKEILVDGDIVNVDVTVTLDGFFGDLSKTYLIGEHVSAERKHVTDVASESLARALAVVRHNCRLGDIGHAIQSYAEAQGCGVVRDFVGHGLGRVFHEDPIVPHYGAKGTGIKLIRGMTFTIEPMINGGDWRHKLLSDGWTALTIDGKPSAQFEHSIALVDDGIEVLTAFPDDAIVARARELGAVILWPELP